MTNVKTKTANYKGIVMDEKANVFSGSRMGLMLPLEPNCMTVGMSKQFQEMANKMLADGIASFELALVIEAYPDGERYFTFEIYGYKDGSDEADVQDCRQVELSESESDYYYKMACKQIMENMENFK